VRGCHFMLNGRALRVVKIRKRWTLFRAVVRELEARPQEDDYGIEIVTDAGTSSVSDLGIAGFELVWGWRRLR